MLRLSDVAYVTAQSLDEEIGVRRGPDAVAAAGLRHGQSRHSSSDRPAMVDQQRAGQVDRRARIPVSAAATTSPPSASTHTAGPGHIRANTCRAPLMSRRRRLSLNIDNYPEIRRHNAHKAAPDRRPQAGRVRTTPPRSPPAGFCPSVPTRVARPIVAMEHDLRHGHTGRQWLKI